MGQDKVYPAASKAAPIPNGAYYSVKDQGHHLPAPVAYHHGKRRRSRLCCCAISLCSFLWTLIVLIGILTLVIWLVLHPKLPKYNVTDVELTGLDSSLTSGTLSTKTSFTVETYNPNKKIGIYYDDIKVRVEADGLNIGSGNLPTFYQEHRNTTVLHTTLVSPDVPIQSDQHSALLTASSKGQLPLYIRVDVKARIKVGSVKSHKFEVKVRCNVVINPTITNGSQLLSKSCKVKR